MKAVEVVSGGSEHLAESLPDLRFSTLQPFAFPEDDALDTLFRACNPANNVPSILSSDPSSLPNRNDCIDFDSYINSFYESYWGEFTSVRNIFLDIEIVGEVFVEIERVSKANPQHVITRKTIGTADEQSRHVIAVPPPHSDLKPFLGRLFARLVALSANVKIVSMAWVTDSVAEQRPRVALVMCTFNKPKDVLRNLQKLAPVLAKETALERFIVVDQGSRFVEQEPGYRETSEMPGLQSKLTILTQTNLGGAGGFTRGMMEALKVPETTHALLMDDDIILETSCFPTLLNLLRFAKTDFVVSGSMFDLYHRMRMHAHAEAANFDTLTFAAVTPHGLDMSRSGAPDAFLEPWSGTYGAWWFCCIPRSAVETVGLPLPVFIRVDDAEFGTRLTSAGVPLVNMPGVFVWHEPFHAKLSAWMFYYEIRNFLVMAKLRSSGNMGDQWRSLSRRFWEFLALGMFDHALAITIAIEDFCKGPEFVFTDTLAHHTALLKVLQTLKPNVSRGRASSVQPLLDSRLRRIPKPFRLLWSMWWTLLMAPKPDASRGGGPVVEFKYFHWLFTHGRPQVSFFNRYSTEHLVMQPDPKLARQLARRFVEASFKWRLNDANLQDSYRAAAPKVTTVAAWCAYLGLDVRDYGAIRFTPAHEGLADAPDVILSGGPGQSAEGQRDGLADAPSRRRQLYLRSLHHGK